MATFSFLKNGMLYKDWDTFIFWVPLVNICNVKKHKIFMDGARLVNFNQITIVL